MGKGSVSSKFLVMFNLIYTLLGVAIIGVSIWFFLRLTSLTSLRNQNHFQLETKIYTIQALPWMLTIAGVFILLDSGCAFLGIMKKSRALVWTNVGFQLLTILLLIATAFMSFKYGASDETDNFVKMTITDAFQYLEMAKEPRVNKAFQAMETDLKCCGSSGPTSYNGLTGWEHSFPSSCCENYGEDRPCLKTNAVANTRKGCIDVAMHHATFAVYIFGGVAVFTAFIGILNLVTALFLTHGLGNRKRLIRAQLQSQETLDIHKSHVSMAEMETLKMPLKV